eukprot:11973441-Alexandrium_andersonii.AAC.1
MLAAMRLPRRACGLGGRRQDCCRPGRRPTASLRPAVCGDRLTSGCREGPVARGRLWTSPSRRRCSRLFGDPRSMS